MAGLYSAITQWSTQFLWWWLLSKQLTCLRVLSVCLCYQQGLHSVLVFSCDPFFSPRSGKCIPTWIWACDSFDLPSKVLRREAKIGPYSWAKPVFIDRTYHLAQTTKCGQWRIDLDEMCSPHTTPEIHYSFCHLLPHGRVMTSSFPKRKGNCYYRLL